MLAEDDPSPEDKRSWIKGTQKLHRIKWLERILENLIQTSNYTVSESIDMSSEPAESTHSLALHCGPLPAEDVLQLGKVLDESHHLSLEALGVNILH